MEKFFYILSLAAPKCYNVMRCSHLLLYRMYTRKAVLHVHVFITYAILLLSEGYLGGVNHSSIHIFVPIFQWLRCLQIKCCAWMSHWGSQYCNYVSQKDNVNLNIATNWGWSMTKTHTCLVHLKWNCWYKNNFLYSFTQLTWKGYLHICVHQLKYLCCENSRMKRATCTVGNNETYFVIQ